MCAHGAVFVGRLRGTKVVPQIYNKARAITTKLYGAKKDPKTRARQPFKVHRTRATDRRDRTGNELGYARVSE